MHDRSTNRSLLVVGSVATDDVDGPFGLHKNVLGGSASFFSVAASYFTQDVSLVAVIGDDFPEQHVDYLRECGVDLAGLERVAGGESFHWHGVYSDDLSSRETVSTKLGVFADFKPTLNDRHRSAELLFLGNIEPSLQLSVAKQSSGPALIAMDTMNLWINEFATPLAEALRAVHLLIINDEEARLLAKEQNLAVAAHKIRQMGPHSVVIKRGDAGAYFFYEGGCFAVPALPLESVKDPTGAGDTFAGGFMGYLSYCGTLEPAAIRNALIAGSVMASYCVEQFSLDGLRNLTPEMIQTRFDEFHALSQYERIQL